MLRRPTLSSTAFDWLGSLDRKLVRDLWHIKGQALAIAVVIGCGVGMYVMSKGMLISLDETRHAYYERYRFADVMASVKRAPNRVIDTIGALPGVRLAQSRIRIGALLDVAGTEAPISGLVLSLPALPEPQINDLVLRSGRYFDAQRPEEILVLEAFAQAHDLKPGDHLHALLNGTRRRLTITGLVLSPEFVYAIAPGEIVPDAKRFGVLWMNRAALGHAFDLEGAFNEVLVLSSPHSHESVLIETLDKLLKPHGGSGAYGRDQQISDQFLANEIDQLNTMGRLLPPIFLLVAAFLLHVVITRLIETEREQIGLLKAYGYSDTQVAWHYGKMVGCITLSGCALGILLGIWLGRGLADIYLDYFKFPFLLFRAPGHVFLIAVGFSMASATLGTFSVVRRVMRLRPAVAMMPPAPPDYSRSARWIESLSPWVDQPSRMILRHLYRWPGRSAMTALGISMSMGLLIGASFSLDAMLHMVDVSFNVIDRQDVTLNFVEERPARALHDVRHAPGVLEAEGFRVAPAVLRHGTHTRRQAIIGMGATPQLSRLVDVHYQPVPLPDAGIVLSDKLAELLDVRIGDPLQVSFTTGRRPELEIPVTAIVKTYLGTSAYMRLDRLNRILLDDAVISGANLLIDDAATHALYRHLKSMPLVAGVGLQEQAQRAFHATLQESLGTFVFFNTLFAGLIAVGVVYNSARISLSERGRELASLRVLGLTRAEVSYILLGELVLLTLLALPVGAALGYLLALAMVLSFNTELFRIPLIIAPSTYAYAALVVVLAALGSGMLVRRRIDRLDLVGVLKTRE